jgi:hypothetical protein
VDPNTAFEDSGLSGSGSSAQPLYQASRIFTVGANFYVLKPGEKLAQFVLVTGPYKTRAEAMEMTRQAQTPRLSYPMMVEALTERLTPRTNTAADKPKEARR